MIYMKFQDLVSLKKKMEWRLLQILLGALRVNDSSVKFGPPFCERVANCVAIRSLCGCSIVSAYLSL